MEQLDRITIDPNVCLGQPTIRGMRITISVILKMLRQIDRRNPKGLSRTGT